MMSRAKDRLIAKIEADPRRPIVLSRSAYDFVKKFLAPRPVPEYVRRSE